MNKKIEIFENGKYICTTQFYLTCKQAKSNYIAQQWHKGITLLENEVKAHFKP